MRKIVLGAVAVALVNACAPAGPRGFEETLHAGVEPLVAAFRETPVVEGNRAFVYWRGEADRVQWIGDHNFWVRETAPDLTRVPGTDLWWASLEFPEAARIDYKFLVNGDEWILDPRCPRTCTGGYGPNSELRMPGYAVPPELRPLPGDLEVPTGRVEGGTLLSAALGEERKYRIYVPPEAEGHSGFPSVWFHDGDGYLEYADAAHTLDLLIARGDIAPTVAVFIPPVRRGDELGLSGGAYLRFVCDELVPHLRARYGISSDPAQTATLGISLGGLAAVRFALARPDVFGLAAGHSGAYNNGNDEVIRDVREGPARGGRFHLVVGTYENALGGDPERGNLLQAQRRLASALAERGYDHQAYEYPEGHSWGLWKANLGRALRYLYRGETASE